MIGEDYSSYDEFMAACERPEEPLNPGHTLAKVYTINQVKDIADKQGFNTHDILEDIDGRGRRRTFNLAYEFVDRINADSLGELLSNTDHDMFFPLLSYAALPSTNPYDSFNNFINYLSTKNIIFDSDFVFTNNGIIRPHGRNCKLESVFASSENESVSILYSCTRILIQPDKPQGDYSNWFLARIPVLLRIIFDHRIAEFSLPRFSEPTSPEGWSNKIPLRYQIAIDSAANEFLQLIGYQFDPINHNKLTLFLEERFNAQDLGWKIAPLETAEFNLEQNVIPLKRILEQFSESLNNEIKRRNLNHPLSKVDLYKLFRALKEKSYTFSLVLLVPLGVRGGSIKMTVLYGNQDSHYLPVIVLSHNDENVVNSLRRTIVESQQEELNNPYDLGALLSEQILE